MRADIFTIKYTKYQSSWLDTEAIQKELPDVAARYTNTNEARRFQVAWEKPSIQADQSEIESPIDPPEQV